MINFIVYEKSKSYQQIYKNIILRYIGPQYFSYRFRFCENYTRKSTEKYNNLDGEFIFLLATNDDFQKTLRFSKYLRKTFLFDPMIIIKPNEENNILFNILPVSFVDKTLNIEKQLNSCLKYSFKVLNYHKSYKFKNNNEIFQIPFEQILYFEKNLNDNSTQLITTEDIYNINKSISKIETELEEEYNFFKTHRSCIVNLDNIKSINFTTNTINFSNCKINLISRNKKKALKEKFSSYQT